MRSSSLSAYERRSIQGAHTQHGSSSQCSLQITSTCGPRSSSLRSTRSRRCQLKLPTAGQASHGVRTHRALACRPPPTVSDRAPLTPRKGSAMLRGARPGRAGGNSVLATSACASTAIPANSAYALTGISGDAASAKSAAAVAAPAAIMACAPPPPSSQRYAVRRTLGPHAWTGGTRMCRHLADSTCGSLGLMLCSCSCRAVFLPGEAAGRARRRGALANVGDARGQRGRDQRLHQRLHVRVKVQEGILAADAEQQVESAQLQRAKVGHLRTPSRARPAGPPRAARVGRAACSQRSALLPLASGCGSTTLAASACGSRDTGPRMRSRQVTGMGSLALILRQGDTTSASRTCLQKHQGPSSHRAPLCEVAALVSAVHDPSLPGGPHAGPSGPARPVRARPRCRLHAPRAVPGTQSSRTDARVGWR